MCRHTSLDMQTMEDEVSWGTKVWQYLLSVWKRHFVPGFALSLLGLWHTLQTARTFFLRRPHPFRSTFWYTSDTPFFGFKHVDLLLLLSFSILAIITQLLDFPLFHFSFKLSNLEHATIFLHLLIFTAFTLFAETTKTTQSLSGLIAILATSVFGQELFLIHFHSTDHTGLEGHYHWLLQIIVSVSFVAAIAATLSPTSFAPAVVLPMSVTLQGVWFINMGFMLWVPEFVPQGCAVDGVAVVCGSREAECRARSLANLQFSWVVCTVLVCTGSACLKLAVQSGRSIQYQQLRSRGGVELPCSVDEVKNGLNLGL